MCSVGVGDAMIKLSNPKQTEALTEWLSNVGTGNTGSIAEGQYGSFACTEITVDEGKRTYHTVHIEIDGEVHEANP